MADAVAIATFAAAVTNAATIIAPSVTASVTSADETAALVALTKGAAISAAFGCDRAQPKADRLKHRPTHARLGQAYGFPGCRQGQCRQSQDAAEG